jgi:L-lactate dehydrogenase complex protein LldF
MLVHLRRRYVEEGFSPKVEKAAFDIFGTAFSSPALYKTVGALGRWVQLNVLGKDVGKSTEVSPLMKIAERFEPLSGWTKHRALPPPPAKSFTEQWDDSEDKSHGA